MQCMEKGLKNLNQAHRSAQKKQGTYDSSHDDSAIGVSDLDEEPDDRPADLPEADPAALQYQTGFHSQRRVPSIHAILQQPMPRQSMAPQPMSYVAHQFHG